MKIPFRALSNEINDVDSARVPILLPQSCVYPVRRQQLPPGADRPGEIYGYLKSRAAGALEYRVYGGTILVDTLIPASSQPDVQDLYVPYVAGGRLLWETPLEGLRLAGSLQALRLNATATLEGMSLTIGLPAELWVASAEYSAHELLFAAEYSRTYTQYFSNNPTLFPPVPLSTAEQGYVMVSYRVTKWLQPGLYYAPRVSEHKRSQGSPEHTTRRGDDAALRHQQPLVAQARGPFHVGHRGAQPLEPQRQSAPLGARSELGSLFFAKTTAYFLSGPCAHS